MTSSQKRMVSIYGGCCTIEGAGNDPYITGIEQELARNLAPLELLLREEVPVDGTALDIGANVGLTSIMTGRHLRDGRVLAFEPDRKAYTFLQRNIERNGLTNIQLFGLAVSQAEGTLAFEEVVDASFASHVAPSAILEEDHAIGQDSQDSKVARRSIPTTTVDSIINTNELQRVDLIKIDVEGHESEVILGAVEALAVFRPIVFMEFNSWTTIVYGRRNPLEVLTFLHERFPYVYEVHKENARRCFTKLRATEAERFSFLARNIFQHGCVDDLVLSFRPLHAESYSSPSRGKEHVRDRNASSDHQEEAQRRAVLPRKLNVGCGYDKRPGYLNIDIEPAVQPDILIKDHDLSVLPKSHFEEVLANDVLEHIPRNFTMHTLLDWAALLRPSGLLILRTTSILGVADIMQAHPTFEFEFNWTSCLFGNQQHPGDFHYTGFTERTLRVHLECAGFEVSSINLRDGWLFETCAVKVRDWTELICKCVGMDDTRFLVAAYQEFFERELDEVGRLHWGGQLREGRSSYDVLKGIVGSREHLYKKAAKLAL